MIEQPLLFRQYARELSMLCILCGFKRSHCCGKITLLLLNDCAKLSSLLGKNSGKRLPLRIAVFLLN